MANCDFHDAPPDRKLEGDAAKVGPMVIPTERGPVTVVDAPGFMTAMVRRPDGESRIGIILYDPEGGGGLISQVDATVARQFSDSFLRLAAELEQEQAKPS